MQNPVYWYFFLELTRIACEAKNGHSAKVRVDFLMSDQILKGILKAAHFIQSQCYLKLPINGFLKI